MSTGETLPDPDLLTTEWLADWSSRLDMLLDNDVPALRASIRDFSGMLMQFIGPAGPVIVTPETLQAAWDNICRAAAAIGQQIDAFVAEARRRNVPLQPPPPEWRAPREFTMTTTVRKGMPALYHDPDCKEACAAIVCKVHPVHHGGIRPSVNLVFWDEECHMGMARNVAWGPGVFKGYWLPGEADQ